MVTDLKLQTSSVSLIYSVKTNSYLWHRTDYSQNRRVKHSGNALITTHTTKNACQHCVAPVLSYKPKALKNKKESHLVSIFQFCEPPGVNFLQKIICPQTSKWTSKQTPQWEDKSLCFSKCEWKNSWLWNPLIYDSLFSVIFPCELDYWKRH